MSNNGWIKLHRQIVDNWIWEDAEMFKAWVDILMMVNHEDKKMYVNGKLVTIHRGEKLTSITKLAERWRWTRRRVSRFLKLLEDDEMCTTHSTTFGTTLKVSNYAEYQDFQTLKRTTVDTTNDTADSTTGDTADDTAHDTQTIMNKNNKNDNNANNFFCAGALKKIPPEKSDVEAYCREKRYRGMDIDGFFEYYDLRDWKLTGGLKMPDWTKAVDYWHSKGKKDAEKGQSDVVYFREFEGGPAIGGDAVPFKGGLAAEMLRRKREKNAR